VHVEHMEYCIYYATGWQTPVLHVRSIDDDGRPLVEDWEKIPLWRTESRAEPDGGSWWRGIVPAGPRTKGKSKLEFVVSDGDGHEDRHPSGEGYVCPVLGGYKLQRGQLKPFPRASRDPIMLVSDLDGTMVDDGSTEADSAMAEFCEYWENVAALCGSKLVYNTGRSLGQFIGLLNVKQGALAMPDVVITAVGTKVMYALCTLVVPCMFGSGLHGTLVSSYIHPEGAGCLLSSVVVLMCWHSKCSTSCVCEETGCITASRNTCGALQHWKLEDARVLHTPLRNISLAAPFEYFQPVFRSVSAAPLGAFAIRFSKNTLLGG
ncbi:unnamed protein product, partial [Ostreobium quekettii]